MVSRKVRRWVLRNHTYNFDILFAMSSVAVFPTQKLIFNRIKKCGNTSVVTFLHELDGQSSHGTTDELKSRLTHVRRLSMWQTFKFPTYYSFAVIRNPYGRLLSGFLHRIAPGHMEEYQTVPGFGENTPEGFEKFVEFLADGNQYFDRHYWPQTELMYQSPSRFNRLVRLEYLVSDMRDLLKDIGQPEELAQKLAKPHQIEQDEKHKITNANRQLKAFYNDRIIQLTEQLYASDFSQLPVEKIDLT